MGVVAEFTPPRVPKLHPASTSLLASTPPPIIRALSASYPLLIAADNVLGVLTWTSRDRFESVLVAASWVLIVRYFDLLLMYFLPLAIAITVVLLAQRDHDIPPSLETIVAVAERAGEKYRLFVAPIASLQLSNADVLRLLFATLFMSPIYILMAYFFITSRSAVLYGGLLLLTWHSLWFQVLRSVAWRFKIVRLAVFFATGIDRTPKDSKLQSKGTAKDTGVSFTYVIYENQRRWIGVGWTPNTVPEERPPWTDPSLNETKTIDMFELPSAEKAGMKWEWVDTQWLLDLSNGGMLGPERPDRLKADPEENEAYVYYNNEWTSPSASPSFSRPTRRRRWVRVARLIRDGTAPPESGLESGPEDGKEAELRQRLVDSKIITDPVTGPSR